MTILPLMKPDELLPFTAAIRGMGRPIAYYPSLSKFLGSTAAAIFISQFIYWEGKQEDEEGWIYKRSSDIMKETGLGRYEIEGARKILVKNGLMLEKKTGSPPQMFYKFEWQAFDEQFSEFVKNNFVVPKKGKEKKKTDTTPEESEEPKINELGLFKDMFDKYYNLQYPEIPFIWSRDNKGGKDWYHLKEIRNKLTEAKKKKNLEKNIHSEPEFMEILNAWEVLLANMSAYHKERNFNPANINSNFNPILQDIINAHGESKNKSTVNRNEQAASSAEFV